MIWPWAALALAAVVAIILRNRLPALEPRPPSTFIGNTAATRLERMLEPLVASKAGLAGIHLLEDASEALAARILLVRLADSSLDLRYYEWHCDISGTLLLNEVRKAADRGVRVRLLLDDNGNIGLDAILAALEHHPNIEVRLFNPFVIRWPKAIGYLFDFRRLNRRMHNKSFSADNQAMIVGGRNIGDSYFGVSDAVVFADLDVLVVGEVVADVSADFDRYWSSGSAHLASRILPPVASARLEQLLHDALEDDDRPLAKRYLAALGSSEVAELIDGSRGLEWAPAKLYSDDPVKGLGLARRRDLLAVRLIDAIGDPAAILGLVSPYFVPTALGVADFTAMAQRGVDVQILTNSLRTNDVTMVHAGYAPCRKPLLRAGVRLWELKGAEPDRRARLKFGRRHIGGSRGTILRSRGSALHAKTFTVDRQRLFVGSFNFDPRSMQLNTEMGLIIESPALAAQLQMMFTKDIADIAYEVKLDGDRLQWIERDDGVETIHRNEPGTGPLQRLILAALTHLPVKWLL